MSQTRTIPSGRAVSVRPDISAQKKRKKKPGKQVHLGVPTPQRAEKSQGFLEENLAGGDGPKVVRAVEKAPFTLPAIRERITQEEIERAIRLRRPADPLSKMTHVDRMLEDHEFGSLARYVITHYRRESGNPARMRYDDTPRGVADISSHREDRWRIDLQWIEFVDDRIHLAGREVLDLIAWQIFPNLREGLPPSKIDIGRAIVKAQGRDRSEGAYEGYLRCLSQMISEAGGAFDIHRRRQVQQRDQRMIDEKRKNAESEFAKARRRG